jgi:hypothetical protein
MQSARDRLQPRATKHTYGAAGFYHGARCFVLRERPRRRDFPDIFYSVAERRLAHRVGQHTNEGAWRVAS